MAASEPCARPKPAFVYMVRCTGGTLYTGWTTDPAARLRAHQSGRGAKVQQAYKNSRDGIVVLPCYLPWKNGLYKTDALFVVYPSQRGGWSAQCVTDHKTKKPKLPFPQSWGGQPQEVIEQKSGIPGISFCHASRFLITAKDKETALAACRQVLKNNGRV